MSLGMIILIVLVLMLLGVIPPWPHSRQWVITPAPVLSAAFNRANVPLGSSSRPYQEQG